MFCLVLRRCSLLSDGDVLRVSLRCSRMLSDAALTCSLALFAAPRRRSDSFNGLVQRSHNRQSENTSIRLYFISSVIHILPFSPFSSNSWLDSPYLLSLSILVLREYWRLFRNTHWGRHFCDGLPLGLAGKGVGGDRGREREGEEEGKEGSRIKGEEEEEGSRIKGGKGGGAER